MATVQIRIGSLINIHQYDDGDYDSAIETLAPIKCGTPIDGNDVLRLNDLGELFAAFIGTIVTFEGNVICFDGDVVYI